MGITTVLLTRFGLGNFSRMNLGSDARRVSGTSTLVSSFSMPSSNQSQSQVSHNHSWIDPQCTPLSPFTSAQPASSRTPSEPTSIATSSSTTLSLTRGPSCSSTSPQFPNAHRAPRAADSSLRHHFEPLSTVLSAWGPGPGGVDVVIGT